MRYQKPMAFSLFVLVMAATTSVHAVIACNTVHNTEVFSFKSDAKIDADDVHQVIDLKLKPDTRFRKEDIDKETQAELLTMLGEAKNANLNEKMLEKGEMNLGRDIGDGNSIEMSYATDLRGEDVKFVLEEVSLVMANGSEQKLLKDPTNLEMNELRETKFVFLGDGETSQLTKVSQKDILPEAQEGSINLQIDAKKVIRQKIKIPLVIEGSASRLLQKWAVLMPYMKHAEIRVGKSAQALNKVLRKAGVRKRVEWLKDRSTKLLFSAVATAAVVSLMTDFKKWKKTFWSLVEEVEGLFFVGTTAPDAKGQVEWFKVPVTKEMILAIGKAESPDDQPAGSVQDVPMNGDEAYVAPEIP